MNKVSIINFNLHKKYLIEDQKDFLAEPNFKQSIKRRNKPPQETLKRLIKKGLVHYLSPFTRPKSGKRIIDGNKQNSIQMRHSQGTMKKNEMNFANKMQSSSSMFTCTRGHGTSVKSKNRMQTQYKENSQVNNRYGINKTMKGGDWDEVLPAGSHMFRDFRNISEQSLSRVNVENERRNFKLGQVHRIKYDSAWKKYPVPQKSKEKELKQSKVQFSRIV